MNFSPICLPAHLREALTAAAPNQLPESTPNPSLTFFSDDYLTPDAPLPYSINGNGKHQKMRIPMERRYVSYFFAQVMCNAEIYLEKIFCKHVRNYLATRGPRLQREVYENARNDQEATRSNRDYRRTGCPGVETQLQRQEH